MKQWERHKIVAIFILSNFVQCTPIDLPHKFATPKCNAIIDHPGVSSSHDFIVIGAGSAGSIVASELADRGNWDILLLEAGGESQSEADIPAYAGELQHTDMNWGYLWEPQTNFGYGLEDYKMSCPQGKALGGTSAISYMIHSRGNRFDYDEWVPNDRTGWGYEDSIFYYKRMENCTVGVQDKDYRGHNGSLKVEDVCFRTKAADAFVQSMKEFGYKYVDYNAAEQIGVSYIQAQTNHGIRENSYKMFLEKKLNSTGVRLLTQALVTKINFFGRKAHSVTYIQDGIRYVVTAKKEIIVSAGAINTPHILMLSGIGPKWHLRQFGIHVIKSLPVGRGLHEHISFLGLTYTVNESITFSASDLLSHDSLTNLRCHGSGPLTSTATIEAIGMVDTHTCAKGSQSYPPSTPNIELLFIGIAPNVDGTDLRRRFRISHCTYDKLWKKIEGKPAFMILPVLLQPKSCGHIRLKSSDPFENPIIYGNFYSDRAGNDIKTMISGIRLIQKIVEMPALKKYNANLLGPIPGCEQFQIDTDSYWECALRTMPITLSNVQSTCKMGLMHDCDAVVDSELQVHGVKNLRVVDASVFPKTLSAHLNAPVYMVAHKISNLIADTYLRQDPKINNN